MTDEDWPERRIVDEMDLNGNEFRQRFLGGEFCTGALDAPGACPGLVEALRTEVDAWLADHGETEDFDDLTAPRPSALTAESILPAAMVGRIVSVDGYGIELPESLRFRLGVRAVAGVETLLETTLDVAQLSAGEAVIWYEPAGVEDADVVEALGGYLWDIPPYLVNVVPVVMVGQETIARAEGPTRPGVGMGRGFTLELMMTTPAGSAWTWSNSALAGVPVGLGVSAGRQGYQTPYEQPASTIQLLSKLTGDYLDGVAASEEQLAALDHLSLVHTMPSTVAVSAVIEPAGTLGMVTDLQFLGIQIDADIWGSGIAGGDMDTRKRWRDLARLEASSRERRLFEDYEITSISADMALILAQAQGVEVEHIDQGNLATALATLPFDSGLESEIEAWVLSGGEADVPVESLDFVQWSGVGYVLRDPSTGEAKYQLAGGLSGGMTVLPPLLIFEALPEMWPATSEETIDDPSLAAILRIPSGLDGQIGEAGSEAGAPPPGAWPWTPSETKVVEVLVLTAEGVPVRDVPVTFEITVGEGGFDVGGFLLANTTTVETNRRGHAKVRFVFDKHTGPVPGDEDNDSAPFYTQIEPDDFYATRVGANLIRVSVGPVGLTRDLWAFSAPGALDQAIPGGAQFSTVPHMLAGRATVTAVDEFGNPIANARVDATLNPTDGAVLTYEELMELTAGDVGTLVLEDFTPPPTAIADELTRSDGKMAYYVILGETNPTVLDLSVTKGDRVREAHPAFVVEPRPDDTVLFAWSGRPVGSQGQWIEAYKPGTPIARPLMLEELYRIEHSRPVRAARNELRASFELGAECPAGSGLIAVNQNADTSLWKTGLLLGNAPGACTVTGRIQENRDGGWTDVLTTFPSPTVWAVEMGLVTPLDPVVVGVENTPVEQEHYRYSIEPLNYVPEKTALVFSVEGQVTGAAQTAGRGLGLVTLEPGMIVLDPTKNCTVQPVINPGMVWGMGTSNPVDLGLKFEEYPLGVIGAGFIDNVPDYSQGGDGETSETSDDDSDNFFLREATGNGDDGDHQGLDVYYRLEASGLDVTDVKINVYAGVTNTLLQELPGETASGGGFEEGESLHVQWSPDISVEDPPGFYRLQLQVFVDGETGPLVETSIDDADADPGNGWQCPQDGLAVHDLIWKHRPVLHVQQDEIGIPSTIDEFVPASGNRAKIWIPGSSQPVALGLGDIPPDRNVFWDLFNDWKVTNGDLSEFSEGDRDILETNENSEAIYYSSNRSDAHGFVFLQSWMFENFSQRPWGWNDGWNWLVGDPDVQHEGDMEYFQVAVRLSDPANPKNKGHWIVPFAATASQHYYAQTLKWDIGDGSAPSEACLQKHVIHSAGRSHIYVAQGSHATYFCEAEQIDVPDRLGAGLGTQEQYDCGPELMVDKTAPAIEKPYRLLPISTGVSPGGTDASVALETFQGRWGFLTDDSDSLSNGPAGPPFRAALDGDGNPVYLLTQPKRLHNLAVKDSQKKEMTIP